ncbi:hypothetical protein D9M72_468180 [compost metagenome]
MTRGQLAHLPGDGGLQHVDHVEHAFDGLPDRFHVAFCKWARGQLVDPGARPLQPLAHALDHQRRQVVAVQAEGRRGRCVQALQRGVAERAHGAQPRTRGAVCQLRFAQDAVGRPAFGRQHVGGVEHAAVCRDVVEVLPCGHEGAERACDHQRGQHERAKAADRGGERQLALQAAGAPRRHRSHPGVMPARAPPPCHGFCCRRLRAGRCMEDLSFPPLLTKKGHLKRKAATI